MGISILKKRYSRYVLSVFRLSKRYNEQTKFSLNNNTTEINVPKKGVTTEVEIFINFCIVAFAASEEKKLQFWSLQTFLKK